MIYVEESLVCNSISVNNFLAADIVRLQVKLESNNIQEIVGIYILQEFSVTSFNEEFNSYLSIIKCPNLVLSGNMNIDLL